LVVEEARMRTCFLVTTLLVFAAALCLQPERAAAQAGGLRINVTQVDGSRFPLVTLYISITDAAGQPAIGLTQGELKVEEDGTPVELVEFKGSGGAPVHTLLVVDRSNSMEGQKLAGAQEAAQTFVDLMRPGDQAGLLLFDHEAELAQPLTTEKSLLKRQIATVEARGGTSLYDAVTEGVRTLAPVSGRKSAIVLSDGMDNRDDPRSLFSFARGSRSTLAQTVSGAKSADVPLYTIGLGDGRELNADALQQMSRETDGAYFHAPTTSDLANLYRTLSQQFQTEYAVTYRSPRAAYDGTHRGIEVKVDTAGGQTATGGGAYLERHLVQLRSTLPVTLLLSALLVVAFVAPLLAGRRRSVALAAVAGPPSTRAAVPPPPPALAPSITPGPAGRFCVSCGTPLRPSASFCTHCGAKQA
jgi:VWFA-related protein